MKNILLIIFLMGTANVFGQNAKHAFDATTWKAPYHLPIDGWTIERFEIPISFAPDIPYSGVEDIRFAKGWGDAKSGEYWTYAFLWYLNGKPEINERALEKNLMEYYNGLLASNIEKRKIQQEKLIFSKASVKKTTTYTGDANTYTAKIMMLDYMQQQPITLNCIIHTRYCAGQNYSFIFYEISPRPLTDSVWINLNKLWEDFKCSN